MRTVRELRLAGLFAYLASLVIALLLSLALHLLLGGQGELGWEGFNAYGLLEGLLFLLAFTWSLALGQRATRIPCSTLLTAGLFGPRAAKRLARPLARVEGVEAYEGRGLALLYQEGRPVGLLGLSDHILPRGGPQRGGGDGGDGARPPLLPAPHRPRGPGGGGAGGGAPGGLLPLPRGLGLDRGRVALK